MHSKVHLSVFSLYTIEKAKFHFWRKIFYFNLSLETAMLNCQIKVFCYHKSTISLSNFNLECLSNLTVEISFQLLSSFLIKYWLCLDSGEWEWGEQENIIIHNHNISIRILFKNGIKLSGLFPLFRLLLFLLFSFSGRFLAIRRIY